MTTTTKPDEDLTIADMPMMADDPSAILPINPLPWVILCDVDGTIADHTDIRGHFDWDLVDLDKPVEAMVELVRELMQWTEIIFVSARKEQSREATLGWIGTHIAKHQWQLENELPAAHTLYMRKNSDERPDAVVKREIYERHIEGRYRVRFVLDDRNSVVRMWREELGLTCLQVAEGNF
jgi:hypothetical protein